MPPISRTPRRGHRDKRRYAKTRYTPDSEIVPFEPGETNMDRHLRRLNVNLEYADILCEWCYAHDWTYEMSEEGYRWTFRNKGTFCEWRVSQHTFYVARRLKSETIHDIHQCIAMLVPLTRRSHGRAVTVQ